MCYHSAQHQPQTSMQITPNTYFSRFILNNHPQCRCYVEFWSVFTTFASDFTCSDENINGSYYSKFYSCTSSKSSGNYLSKLSFKSLLAWSEVIPEHVYTNLVLLVSHELVPQEWLGIKICTYKICDIFKDSNFMNWTIILELYL